MQHVVAYPNDCLRQCIILKPTIQQQTLTKDAYFSLASIGQPQPTQVGANIQWNIVLCFSWAQALITHNNYDKYGPMIEWPFFVGQIAIGSIPLASLSTSYSALISSFNLMISKLEYWKDCWLCNLPVSLHDGFKTKKGLSDSMNDAWVPSW